MKMKSCISTVSSTFRVSVWSPSFLFMWAMAIGAVIGPIAAAEALDSGVSASPAKLVFYVARDGNDGNPGTAKEPFATVFRARDAIRSACATTRRPVDVVIRAGTYYLRQPFILSPEDSGTKACPITYVSLPGEDVLISGGTPIAGNWRTEDGKVFFVDIPEIRDARVPWAGAKGKDGRTVGRWNFRQLDVDGQLKTRARYPNASLPDPYMYVVEENGKEKGVKQKSVGVVDELGNQFHAIDSGEHGRYIPAPVVRTTWETAPDAVVWANIAWNGWTVNCDIKKIDTVKKRIYTGDDVLNWQLTGSESNGYDKPDWFYVSGVLEELDEPGEWHLDPVAGRLYYWPEDGTMDGKTVIAPRLDSIIVLQGDAAQGTHVDHITFRNLKIAHAQYRLNEKEPRLSTDGAVMFVNARWCRLENCEVSRVGGNAVWLLYDCLGNTVTGCDIHHFGGAGILTSGARPTLQSGDLLFNADRRTWPYAPLETVITHKSIHHGGMVSIYGPGVHIDSAPMRLRYKKHAYIAHNLFHDMPKWAVFAFVNVGQVVVEYNKCYRTGGGTRDTGIWYPAYKNCENGDQFYILNNHCYDIPGVMDGRYGGRATYGLIYADYGAHMNHIENNLADGDIDPPNMRYIFLNAHSIVPGNGIMWSIPGGNVFKAPAHPSIDLDQIGPGKTASNDIDIEEDLGVAAEWWEDAVVRQGDAWYEHAFIMGAGKLPYTRNQLACAKEHASPEVYVDFNLSVPKAGRYQVYVYFIHDDSSCATNLPITVFHKGGQDVVRLDQRRQNKRDTARDHGHLVGDFEFGAGQTRIRIGTDDARGNAYIRGVALLRRKIFIQDREAAGSPECSSKEWTPEKSNSCFGGSYMVSSSPDARPVIFGFDALLETGEYDTYLWLPVVDAARSRSMSVIINGANGHQKMAFDLAKGTVGWNKLGCFRFSARSSRQSVQIQPDADGGQAIADAIKIVRVDPAVSDQRGPALQPDSSSRRGRVEADCGPPR